MKALPKFRDHAIKLRKQGLSYSEILREVPVAQSTISNWCKNITLNLSQQRHLQKLRTEGVKRGSDIRHNKSENLKQALHTSAISEVGEITTRELWLIGTALYWAEGSKQRIKALSQGVKFTNSDPYMIKVFDLWLTKIHKIPSTSINYEIYLHESMISEKTRVISYWSKILEKPEEKFDRIYLKRNKISKSYPKTDYKGVVRIVVKKSTNLNRQISGWQQGIVNSCGIV